MRTTLLVAATFLAISTGCQAQRTVTLDNRITGALARMGVKDFAGARQEFVPARQDMAEHDPFIMAGETDYWVRVKARRLLDKMAIQ